MKPPSPGGILVTGPSGSGKTSLVNHLSNITGKHREVQAHTVFLDCQTVDIETFANAKKQLEIKASIWTFLYFGGIRNLGSYLGKRLNPGAKNSSTPKISHQRILKSSWIQDVDESQTWLSLDMGSGYWGMKQNCFWFCSFRRQSLVCLQCWFWTIFTCCAQRKIQHQNKVWAKILELRLWYNGCVTSSNISQVNQTGVPLYLVNLKLLYYFLEYLPHSPKQHWRPKTDCRFP